MMTKKSAGTTLRDRLLDHLQIVGLVVVTMVTVFTPSKPTQSVVGSSSIEAVEWSEELVGVPVSEHLPRESGYSFPIGVFEDANVMDVRRFEALIRDAQARGLDTVLFTNNQIATHHPLLEVSDRLDFNVIWAPMYELDRQWWTDTRPATADRATAVAGSIVDAISHHRSLRGYNLVDEPPLALRDRLTFMVQAFKERDPTRTVTAVLIGADRVPALYQAARPDVLLIDVYPYGANNPSCDLTMSGFGYRFDFVQYVREVTRTLPTETPFWVVLQAHRFDNEAGPVLREPSVEEIRLQQWLAVGEGAQGIFWFIYSSQQGWRGLRDNPPLFDEVSNLAYRLAPLREVLAGARRIPNEFSALSAHMGSRDLYVSTLERPDGSRIGVVVNRSCTEVREVRLRSLWDSASFLDLETSVVYRPGTSFSLAPGDGRIVIPIRAALGE